MCGIAGIFDPRRRRPDRGGEPRRHGRRARAPGAGPEGDLPRSACRSRARPAEHHRPRGGAQPIPNEDETVWIVLNGEIYNYPGAEGPARDERATAFTTTHRHRGPRSSLRGKRSGLRRRAQRAVRLRHLGRARPNPSFSPGTTSASALCITPSIDGLFLFASEIKALFASKLAPSAGPEPAGPRPGLYLLDDPAGHDRFRSASASSSPGIPSRVNARGPDAPEILGYPLSPARGLFAGRPRGDQRADPGPAHGRDQDPPSRRRPGRILSQRRAGFVGHHGPDLPAFQQGLRTFGVRFEEQAFDEGGSSERDGRVSSGSSTASSKARERPHRRAAFPGSSGTAKRPS